MNPLSLLMDITAGAAVMLVLRTRRDATTHRMVYAGLAVVMTGALVVNGETWTVAGWIGGLAIFVPLFLLLRKRRERAVVPRDDGEAQGR